MIKITFKDKDILAPSCWDDIHLEDYYKVFNGLEEYTDVIKREVMVISRLTNIDYNEMLDLPVDEYNKLADEFKWIYTLDITDKDSVIIDGKTYRILSKEKMTTKKYIDLDVIRKTDELTEDLCDKWLTCLSIMLEEGDTENYNGLDSRLELKSKLKVMSCIDILPLLSFFFKKSMRSQIIFNQSLMVDTIQTLVNEAKNTMNSLDTTNG